MGIAMLAFGWAGLLIDRRLGTTPFLTAFLFLSGGAVSFWYGISRLIR